MNESDEPYGCEECRVIVSRLAPGETYECENCGTAWVYDENDHRGPWPIGAV